VDTAVVNTPQGEKVLHVCRDGNVDSTEWIDIYEEAFPAEQRQPLNELQAALKSGDMELDETRDAEGDILCMTITEVFREKPQSRGPQFLLACYTAVVKAFRGCGIGTVHRKRCETLLQSEYPTFLGLFSEIESTTEEGVPPDAMAVRTKRKSFFMKLGLQPLDIQYWFPNYEGGQPVPGELLWYPFASRNLDTPTLVAALTRIYVEGYGLEENDPQLARLLEQFGSQVR
jgi:hypothetical protein